MVSDVARTHVCFRSMKSGVRVPVCGAFQWCLMAYTCALRTHVLLGLGIEHMSSDTHAHHGLRREPRSVFAHTHTCVSQKQGTRGHASLSE